MEASPCAFNAERREAGGLAFVEVMLDELIDPGAARATAKAGTEFAEILAGSGRHHLHVAVLGVAHPAAQIQFPGFAMHEPAEAHTLDTSANEEVKDHRRPVLQTGLGRRNP